MHKDADHLLDLAVTLAQLARASAHFPSVRVTLPIGESTYQCATCEEVRPGVLAVRYLDPALTAQNFGPQEWITAEQFHATQRSELILRFVNHAYEVR